MGSKRLKNMQRLSTLDNSEIQACFAAAFGGPKKEAFDVDKKGSCKICGRTNFHDTKKINRHFLKNYDKRPRKNYDWIGFWNESWDVCHNSSKSGSKKLSSQYTARGHASWLEDTCVLARRHDIVCPGQMTFASSGVAPDEKNLSHDGLSHHPGCSGSAPANIWTLERSLDGRRTVVGRSLDGRRAAVG